MSLSLSIVHIVFHNMVRLTDMTMGDLTVAKATILYSHQFAEMQMPILSAVSWLNKNETNIRMNR